MRLADPMHLVDPSRLRDPDTWPAPVTLELLARQVKDAFDGRFHGWREALRQDAAESIGRLPWSRHVRGVHVPVHDMLVVPLARSAETLLRRFADDAAALASREAVAHGSDLDPDGEPFARGADLPPDRANLVVTRRLLEGAVPFRRRFEEDLALHIDRLYSDAIRPAFEAALTRVAEARRGLPARP